MATSLPDIISAFGKGHSDTNELHDVYGNPLANYDPKALMYSWYTTSEISGLDTGVTGNNDFSTFVSLQYSDSPDITYFTPNIAAPGTDFDSGKFAQTVPVLGDLPAQPNVVAQTAMYDSGGSLGSQLSPLKTSVKIAKQKIGGLLSGQSYDGSGN